MKEYKYNGAKALVLLHEKHMKSFLSTWQQAKSLEITLPKTNDPDYESLLTLLRHVLRSSGNYMIWICEKLDLPNPNIDFVPELINIDRDAEKYLEHLLNKWNSPLSEIEEERFYSSTFTSNWNVNYCIDSMLEHAVMHPIRHEFQLCNLIVEQTQK